MKIIDFETYGNVVRFYYGLNTCNDYDGDDWDDIGSDDTVYRRYIKGYIDIAVDSDHIVLTPFDVYPEVQLCKLDLKARKAPCIVVIKQPDDGITGWNRYILSDYSKFSGSDAKGSVRIYFGDDISVLDQFTVLRRKRRSFDD